jgi:carbamoyl-phosphate synthase large subunit
VAHGIIKSLKLANSLPDPRVSYRIISADMSPEAVGLYRSDLGLLVPPISSPDYVDSIIQICKNESVHAIFIGADEELQLMASSEERIESETGAIVITNPIDVISTCKDKWETMEFLRKNNLPHPRSALPQNKEQFLRESSFPVIVKPREGHGSLHLYIAKSREEVEKDISEIKKFGWRPMIQEYVPTDNLEFTIGVTVDKEGKYVMSSIAMKRTLKDGQTYKAFIDDYPDIRKMAELVALRLRARGPVNIQGRLSEDKLKIFEINPRFSGSCPLRAVAKVNEPDIVFRNQVLDEKITLKEYRKMVCFRYWNEVYVPFGVFERAANEGRVNNAASFIPDYF